MSKVIQKTEFLEDMVRIYYFLRRPIGEDDVHDIMEIPYSRVPSFPRLTDKQKEDVEKTSGQGYRTYSWLEHVYIKSLDKTLAFVMTSTPEKCMGPRSESMSSPYLD